MRERPRPEDLRWITDDGHVLADSVRVADTFWRRLAGLQFTRTMPTGCVLWLKGCRSVHTSWMRYSIDIYFLDDSLRVVDVRLGVPPWRIVRPRSREARHVIEARRLEPSVVIGVGLQTQLDTAQRG